MGARGEIVYMCPRLRLICIGRRKNKKKKKNARLTVRPTSKCIINSWKILSTIIIIEIEFEIPVTNRREKRRATLDEREFKIKKIQWNVPAGILLIPGIDAGANIHRNACGEYKWYKTKICSCMWENSSPVIFVFPAVQYPLRFSNEYEKERFELIFFELKRAKSIIIIIFYSSERKKSIVRRYTDFFFFRKNKFKRSIRRYNINISTTLRISMRMNWKYLIILLDDNLLVLQTSCVEYRVFFFFFLSKTL